MKKKISDIYAVYQRLINTKMSGMNSDKAWKLIMFITEAKKVASAYDSFREQTINSLKPEDWENKLPLIQKVEKGEDVEGKEELLAYRDAFLSKANEILAREWNKEVEISTVSISIIQELVESDIDNWSVNDAVSLVEFFS